LILQAYHATAQFRIAFICFLQGFVLQSLLALDVGTLGFGRLAVLLDPIAKLQNSLASFLVVKQARIRATKDEGGHQAN
jgi:hypothetical protein